MVERRKFADLPVIALADFLRGEDDLKACKRLAEALKKYSCVVVEDPRVNQGDSDRFLDQMEAYFAQSTEAKMEDARPDINFQVGVCPEFTEIPRNNGAKIRELNDSEKPTVPQSADAKWRFFWRIGDRAAETRYPELNATPVVPQAFPQWAEVMNDWGTKLHLSARCVAEMLAVGLDLDKDSITNKLERGSHLLAPTGSDLVKFGKLNTVLAGFHYDLNALTVHGKSRYPGLYIWTAEGERLACKVPPGCLLVQAGIQIEWLTAGAIKRGFHEVIVDDAALKAVANARKTKEHIWRVSSTFFAHVASDEVLEPLGHFKSSKQADLYSPIVAGDQVLEELRAINLASIS